MALSKIQPASMDLTDNYAFTGTNSVSGGGDIEETKLATLTASSSSTLDFTSSIDSTYNIYKFRFVNIHSSATAELRFQGNAAGGSGFNETMTTTYFVSRHDENGSNGQIGYDTGNDQANGTDFQRLADNFGNDNDASLCGDLFLFNPSDTTFVTHFLATTQYYQSAVPRTNNTFVAGYFNTTSAIDEIQFKMSSGNIDSGRIALYGIK